VWDNKQHQKVKLLSSFHLKKKKKKEKESTAWQLSFGIERPPHQRTQLGSI